MCSRWSMGMAAAIAVAIVVVSTSQPVWPAPATRMATPTEVTLALRADDPTLRIAHGEFALTIGF